jgi:osmotically-inducible protein OsmY
MTTTVSTADRLRTRILSALAEHAFSRRSVRVIVIGRSAILWGVVRDRITAVLAEDLALAVDGIERCDNRLLPSGRDALRG